ncbi:hypothetical protein ACFQV2_11055 [Actinokineospora soli]|uniref:AAA ATPase domain-containing protein n=1 Tax=Actinokineospora soli TaxID=1048753 RepID=A0ABW2TM31_9PSEU
MDRHTELALARAAIARPPAVLLVTGAAGIGKSWFAEQAVRGIDGRVVVGCRGSPRITGRRPARRGRRGPVGRPRGRPPANPGRGGRGHRPRRHPLPPRPAPPRRPPPTALLLTSTAGAPLGTRLGSAAAPVHHLRLAPLSPADLAPSQVPAPPTSTP